MAGIPSGPGELECLSFRAAVRIAFSSKQIDAMQLFVIGTLFTAAEICSAVSDSLENTEENLFANKLQIAAALSAVSLADTIIDGNPVSLRCSLMKFQNFLGSDFSLSSIRRRCAEKHLRLSVL